MPTTELIKSATIQKSSKTSKVSKEVCDLNWILKEHKPPLLSTKNRSITLVDLFCGCGGMSLGIWEALRNSGFNLDIKLALDINKTALDVYQKNFNLNSNIAISDDINNLIPQDIHAELNSNEVLLKKRIKNLDILVAGPPCQGHSNLNNYTRRNDPRNELYLKVGRFVEITKPKIVIIENVSSVIHDKEKVVNKSEELLKLLGYTTFSLIFDTSDFGLPQIRKRHLLIGLRKNPLNIFKLDPYKVKETVPISSYLQDIIDENKSKKGIFFTPSVSKKVNKERIEYLFKNKMYDLPNSERPKCHKEKEHSYKSSYGRMHWNKPAQTITSGFGSIGQGRYIHPLRKRVITPHEAARIQGFPDFFDFTSVSSRTELHEIIANAVPPKVMAIITNFLIQSGILK